MIYKVIVAIIFIIILLFPLFLKSRAYKEKKKKEDDVASRNTKYDLELIKARNISEKNISEVLKIDLGYDDEYIRKFILSIFILTKLTSLEIDSLLKILQKKRKKAASEKQIKQEFEKINTSFNFLLTKGAAYNYLIALRLPETSNLKDYLSFGFEKDLYDKEYDKIAERVLGLFNTQKTEIDQPLTERNNLNVVKSMIEVIIKIFDDIK